MSFSEEKREEIADAVRFRDGGLDAGRNDGEDASEMH